MRPLGVKCAALLTGVCLALAVIACGDDASSSPPAKLTKPQVQPPDGPPPEELVVEEVWEGSGPTAEVGDEVSVQYVAVDELGDELYNSWDDGKPYAFDLSEEGLNGQGFEEGIEGMQVGGRRKLSIPPTLAPGKEPLYYVVDLVAVR